MQTEMDISIPNKIFRGNNFDIDCHINVNLSTYKIHAELFDRFYSSIELDTTNNGGASGEITVDSGSGGTFQLHFAKDLTTLFHLISYLEITLIDVIGKEQTVWFDVIKFTDNIYMRV
ncbi:MAG: hypothetical protein NT139_01175 [Candidatus Woesearchaeota archaeon]|nr:hypothetical protein [Candidatus Woesearchaeota archaeon]